MDKLFKMTNKGGRGEIILYAEIGGFFGVQSLEFLQMIQDMGNVSNVDLRVSSEGGSVITAIDMFNAIRRHPANWTAYIDGLAASAASWLVLATNKVIMADNAQYMIHRAHGMAVGTPDQIIKTANLMQDIEQNAMINAYTNKTGLSDTQIMDMLNAETWMNAGRALELGFVDQIDGAMDMAASVRLSGRYDYEHPPKHLIANKAKGDDEPSETPKLQAAQRRMMEMKHLSV